VNPTLAALVLVALAGALFMLPLLPAIVELRLKRDAQPLNVIQQHAGEIRHFANGFRKVAVELQGPLRDCVALGTTAAGRLPDGDEYLLIGRADNATWMRGGKPQPICRVVVATGADAALPDGMTFAKEIYAAGRLTGGKDSTYRAILGEEDVRLQRASKVTRWAHAVGTFRAEYDCDLYGRVSSDREINLQSGCVFQRLNAPRISFGDAAAKQIGSGALDAVAGPQSLPAPAGRTLYDEDFDVPPGAVIPGSIVTRGKLRIGAGARVLGSAKSDKAMTVDAGACVQGSLISAGTMDIGPDCRVGGPVVAERGLVMESGTRCGAIHSQTTVSAPTIEIEEGALVFGTLWAREEGRVVPKA
jgi:cytoskeletal protein CcmA (bactofilin family)